MVKFLIPYNSDLEITKEIIRRYKPRIEEIYFTIDPKIATTSKGDKLYTVFQFFPNYERYIFN